MKKILIVATVVEMHIAKFHFPCLEMLKNEGWETAVAARNDYENPSLCNIPFCDTYYDVPFERSPFKLANIKAYQTLKKIVANGEYDIIHCHTPVGAMLTRLAAVTARKQGTKVIYTAHGFHFYKGAPLKNWLLYYPVEWLLSWITDVLITINKEDYARAKKRLHAKKIEYMSGVGIDFAKFDIPMFEAERATKRAELGVPEQAKMLVSVGELNRNKNHEVIIRALAKLDDSNVHYCIAGKGELRDKLIDLAEELGVDERVHLLGHRSDIAQIYKAGDICCFPSIREGLGMAVLEGIVCGLPVVAADNRGTRDIIANGESGILCPPNDVDAFAAAIQTVLGQPEMAEKMTKNVRNDVERFSVESALLVLREIYRF